MQGATLFVGTWVARKGVLDRTALRNCAESRIELADSYRCKAGAAPSSAIYLC